MPPPYFVVRDIDVADRGISPHDYENSNLIQVFFPLMVRDDSFDFKELPGQEKIISLALNNLQT